MRQRGEVGTVTKWDRRPPHLQAAPVILILEQQSQPYAWLLSHLVLSWPLAYAGLAHPSPAIPPGLEGPPDSSAKGLMRSHLGRQLAGGGDALLPLTGGWGSGWRGRGLRTWC